MVVCGCDDTKIYIICTSIGCWCAATRMGNARPRCQPIRLRWRHNGKIDRYIQITFVVCAAHNATNKITANNMPGQWKYPAQPHIIIMMIIISSTAMKREMRMRITTISVQCFAWHGPVPTKKTRKMSVIEDLHHVRRVHVALVNLHLPANSTKYVLSHPPSMA